MPLSTCTNTFERLGTRRVALLLAAALTMLFADHRAHAATLDQDPLKYARGFLITGDYVAGGVDLNPNVNIPVNGLATGIIPMTGVPANTDIVGAFLYWEAIYAPGAQPTDGAQFRGVKLDPTVAWPTNGVPGLKGSTYGSPLPGTNTSNCWGSANVAGAQLTMFRADVMRLLPKLFDARGNWTGQYLVNDTDLANNVDLNGQVYAQHSVTLPETSGNHAVQSAGATLVVIYRYRTPASPDAQPVEQLTKVALYDGVYVQAQGNAMAQTLRSFYQHAGTNARITPIAGTGAGNTKTELFFNGALVTLNPFPMTSPSSDRSWSFPTYSVTMGNLSTPATTLNGPGFYDGYGETATTGIDHTNSSPYECVALAGLVFSTQMLDNDKDGLPDALEASSAAGSKPWRNPDVDLSVTDPGRLLPDLHAMGASPNQKDIVVEIGAMQTTAPTPYGSAAAPFDSSANPVLNTVIVPAHSHLPGPDVLKMLGDAYFNQGVVSHFDVGNTATYLGNASCGSATPDPVCQYLVPSAVARGGEMITEAKCVPQDPNNPYATCRFYDYPGTVGWKFGFEAFRDAPVTDDGQELTSVAQLQTWYAGTTANYTLHRRRFDSSRRQFVHYVLYAHAQGRSKSLPCVLNGDPVVNGHPADYDVGGTSCSTNNPFFQPLDYHVPSSSSGVSDLPGNGALVTLGLWDKVFGTGTTFGQASTTMHELGHNLELSHGGKPPKFGNKKAGTVTYVEPNCKPNYFSTMSYLFQVHGLIDVFGNQHLDYSGSAENDIHENALADVAYGPTPIYQPTWFAPASSPLATLLNASQATRLCNGLKVSELATPPAIAMARVWSPVPSIALDWNVAVDWLGDDPANPTGGGITSNANFDGVFDGDQTFSDVLNGWNDWAKIRLTQIGAAHGVGRSVVGPEFDASSGDVAEDCLGCGDVAEDCLGCGDVPSDCPGCGDVAEDCLGCGDVASDCPGCGDVAEDCLGCGDVAEDCLGCGAPRDIDFRTAKNMGRTPPPSFKACILGADPSTQQGCIGPWTDNNGVVHQAQPAAGDPTYHRVYTTWKIPSVDNAQNYLVYRQRGSTVPVNWQNSAVLVGTPATTSFVDDTETLPHTGELPNGLSFTFFALAVYDDGPSGVSNFVLIAKAIDDAPTANADFYSTGKGVKLTVQAAQGVLANDTDDDSPHFTDFTTNPAPNGRGVAVLVSPPSNAAKNGFKLNPDGSFTYNPAGGFVGTDSFTYVANDGTWSRDNGVPLSGNSALPATTVTITVTK
jgi:Bacterial Ig domain